jgi:HEAT repeat protein
MSIWTREEIVKQIEDLRNSSGESKTDALWGIGAGLGRGNIRQEDAHLVLPPLHEALASAEWKVRSIACGILRRFDPAGCRASTKLRELADSDPNETVRQEAKKALGELRDSIVDRVTSIYHCFSAGVEAVNTENLSALARLASFALDDYQLGPHDFDGLPDRPPDCTEDGRMRPFSGVRHQTFKDSQGEHGFELTRMKTSVVSLLAGLPADQVESFCRRWSTSYQPFQWPKHLSLEVAERMVRDEALSKLQTFLGSFRPFCHQALAEKKDIYLLWEWHKYWRP